VLPPLHAGWAVRRKSNHFAAYDEVANDFAKAIGIDPWRINPYFRSAQCQFPRAPGRGMPGRQRRRRARRSVREKYKEYGIDETPYVVVKADAGTYGMGVMTVKDADEVIALNRKQRNKMSVVKEGLEVSEVHHPGRRAFLRTLNDAGRRTGGLHDRPLRRRRLLPRAYRARQGREPQRAGHALRAAGLRDQVQPARRCNKPGCAAQPLLRLRRGRPPGLLAAARSNWNAPRPKTTLAGAVTQQLHFEKHLLGGSSQSLKLAFILDPLAELKAWKDSSRWP
jgi:hypothetical protein